MSYCTNAIVKKHENRPPNRMVEEFFNTIRCLKLASLVLKDIEFTFTVEFRHTNSVMPSERVNVSCSMYLTRLLTVPGSKSSKVQRRLNLAGRFQG